MTIRRYGEPVIDGVRYRLRQGAYAILLRGDRVLLTHQAEPEPEYQLPGGGIDPGEQPLAALHREVREETGWTIGDLRRLGAYRRFVWMPDYEKWAEKLCTIYVARPGLRLGPPTEPGHSAVWMPAADVARRLGSPGDAAFARRYLGG